MKKNVSPQDEELIGYLQGLTDDIPARDPETAARGRAQFMALADFYRKPVSLPQQNRLNQWIGSNRLIGKMKEYKVMMTLASILATLVLVFGGGGMTVYAAQDSLPSDFLYPLKLQFEELRLDINTDPVKEVGLMTAFANYRADEIVQLANQGEEIPAGLVTQLETQLNTMMQMVANLDPDTAEVCLLQVRQNLRTRDQVRSMTAMPEDVNPPLMQLQHTLQFHHRLAEIGVDDPLEFRNQFRFQQDGNAGPPEEATETPVVTDTPTETVEPPKETPGPPYGPQDGSCQDGETCEPVGDQNGPQNGKDEAGPPDEGEEPPHGNQNGDCDQDCEPIGTGQPDDAGQGTSQPDNGQDSGNGGNQDNSGGSGKNK